MSQRVTRTEVIKNALVGQVVGSPTDLNGGRISGELYGDRLTVISQNPVQYARHGAIMGPNGREDVHADVAVAFAATVRYYSSLLTEA